MSTHLLLKRWAELTEGCFYLHNSNNELIAIIEKISRTNFKETIIYYNGKINYKIKTSRYNWCKYKELGSLKNKINRDLNIIGYKFLSEKELLLV